MAEYQNIFTRVQIRSPMYPARRCRRGIWARQARRGFSYLLGRFGDAQIGPSIWAPWAWPR